MRRALLLTALTLSGLALPAAAHADWTILVSDAGHQDIHLTSPGDADRCVGTSDTKWSADFAWTARLKMAFFPTVGKHGLLKPADVYPAGKRAVTGSGTATEETHVGAACDNPASDTKCTYKLSFAGVPYGEFADSDIKLAYDFKFAGVNHQMKLIDGSPSCDTTEPSLANLWSPEVTVKVPKNTFRLSNKGDREPFHIGPNPPADTPRTDDPAVNPVHDVGSDGSTADNLVTSDGLVTIRNHHPVRRHH